MSADSYLLTDEQADIVAHALRQVYLFDGWQWLKKYNPDDAEVVADTLVALGYTDPREDEE
jgi:DUF1680 family protein